MSRSTFTPLTAILALLLPSIVLLIGIFLSPPSSAIYNSTYNSTPASSSDALFKLTTPRPTTLRESIQWMFNPASLRTSTSTHFTTSSTSMVNQTQSPAASLRRGDVYFLSHGGPPTIEQYESGPYKAWQKFGRTITAEQSKPKGIVAVSAHWENEDRYGPGAAGVIVNSNTTNPLIYDFGGFPKHFYQFQFRSNADPALQAKVVDVLKKDGIPVRREDRGLDHGVWIPFKAAFGDDSPLPIVQVSLPGTSDPQASVKLGKSLSKLRDEGYAIVATGQVVHNLRDLFTGRKMPYTKPFLQAVESALSSSGSTRANEDPSLSATLDLLNSPLYKKAHPTDEHFFPLLVALGAVQPRTPGGDSEASSAGDKGDIREKIYMGVVDVGGSPAEDTGLGWGMWRWTHTRANASS